MAGGSTTGKCAYRLYDTVQWNLLKQAKWPFESGVGNENKY